jgi:hypothetical protein
MLVIKMQKKLGMNLNFGSINFKLCRYFAVSVVIDNTVKLLHADGTTSEVSNHWTYLVNQRC